MLKAGTFCAGVILINRRPASSFYLGSSKILDFQVGRNATCLRHQVFGRSAKSVAVVVSAFGIKFLLDFRPDFGPNLGHF